MNEELKEVKTQILKMIPKALAQAFGIVDPKGKFQFLIDPDNKKAMGVLSANQVESVYLSYGWNVAYGDVTQQMFSDQLLDSNKSKEGKGIQSIIDFEKASKTIELPVGLVSAPTRTEPEKKRGIRDRIRRKKDSQNVS